MADNPVAHEAPTRAGLSACDAPPAESETDETALGTAIRRRIVAAAADADATSTDHLRHAEALEALGFHRRADAARRRAGIMPAAPPIGATAPPRLVDPAGVHIFLSARQPRLDEADRSSLSHAIGAQDYSYGFAMRGFAQGLDQIGLPYSILPDPACIADIRDRSAAACNIHLGFYPPEQLRLLKGAHNIACMAWEFDRLRSLNEVVDPHAFADQATMLALPDALWVPSAHGAAAIARSVKTPIRVVPAPVVGDLRDRPRAGVPQPARVAALAEALGAVSWQPLAILPREQAAMNHRADLHRLPLARIVAGRDGVAPSAIFVTALNVHDYRKQIRPMLQGFVEFARAHPDALLLVKSSTPARGVQPINSFLLAEQIFEVGKQSRPLVSDRIWITDDMLTRAEMSRLYDIAGFYLCTSHAEGQNLTLLEAMGRGVVPVTVDHTAMADYIRANNAVPIRSHRRSFGMRLSRRYGMYGLDTNFVDVADVRAALATASALDQADYAARSAAALATVRAQFGPAPLLAALRDTIAAIRASVVLA